MKNKISNQQSTISNCLFITFIFSLLLSIYSKANNLQIGIPTVAGNTISFTIQWDNSWYTVSPANYDAVWVFIKYQDCAAPTIWAHAPLSTASVDHSVTGGVLQVDAVTDGMGVFIHRAALGTGNIVSCTVTLTFGGAMPVGTYNFKVFGIEMVQIPQADFYLGDGNANPCFKNFQITSEAAIPLATLGGTNTVALPDAYPKGYAQIYCMKYEISQEQYVDFLNCLTYSQQVNYVTALPNVAAGNWALYTGASAGVCRNGIKVMTTGIATTTPAVYGCDLGGTAFNQLPNNIYNETFDGQNVACNFLSCTDVEGFLDWAALRPMTELEFEKICRGVSGSVPNEFPWGTTNITSACSHNTVPINLDQNGISEVASNIAGTAAITGNGLCIWSGSPTGSTTSSNNQFPYLVWGPLRVGFAATPTTTREPAGATYWGVLEMGGNVWEKCVNTNAAGSTFIGTLGDGNVAAQPADWPTGNTTSMISRGGSWYVNSGSSAPIRTSNRQYNNSTNYLTRTADTGGRGVRQY